MKRIPHPGPETTLAKEAVDDVVGDVTGPERSVAIKGDNTRSDFVGQTFQIGDGLRERDGGEHSQKGKTDLYFYRSVFPEQTRSAPQQRHAPRSITR
jgi:hypothetical protein